MPNLNQLQTAALLADAAYATDLQDNMTGQALEEKLKSGLTPTLAKLIGDNFEVASAIDLADLPNSGFAAVVWRGRATTPYAGQIYVSMRGTEEWTADFLTDLELIPNGNAGRQVLDMVNWWLRITTPASQWAMQYFVEPASGAVERLSDARGTGQISAAERAAGTRIIGHSLGGFLASAYTRLLGNHAKLRRATTFNSAGFATDSDPGFNVIAAANEATFAGRPGRGSGGLRRASQGRTKACVGAML